MNVLEFFNIMVFEVPKLLGSEPEERFLTMDTNQYIILLRIMRHATE